MPLKWGDVLSFGPPAPNDPISLDQVAERIQDLTRELGSHITLMPEAERQRRIQEILRLDGLRRVALATLESWRRNRDG